MSTIRHIRMYTTANIIKRDNKVILIAMNVIISIPDIHFPQHHPLALHAGAYTQYARRVIIYKCRRIDYTVNAFKVLIYKRLQC